MMQVGCRPPKNEMKSGAKIRPVVRTSDYIVQARHKKSPLSNDKGLFLVPVGGLEPPRPEDT